MFLIALQGSEGTLLSRIEEGTMMKSAALLVLALLPVALQAQYCDFLGKDSVVVKTAGDTLTVWDFAACANCGSRFATTV